MLSCDSNIKSTPWKVKTMVDFSCVDVITLINVTKIVGVKKGFDLNFQTKIMDIFW